MKRTAGIGILLAVLGGCAGPGGGEGALGTHPTTAMPHVPGVQGPWGQPVSMISPYAYNPPSGAKLAQQMMAASVPLNMVQGGGAIMPASATSVPGSGSGVVSAGGFNPPGVTSPTVLAPPGVPARPGDILPVSGPAQPPLPPVPNAVGAVGAVTGPHGPSFHSRRTEVRFVGPAGMKISWPDPTGASRGNQIEAPGRYNFLQGAIYRLKFTDLPGRPGVDLYPTLEVVPANLRTDAYIAHSAVPLYLTDEDIEQVLAGNFLVKVIYLPNPQYADVAVTGGPDEIVSTRLEPGLDPIAEACKRGSIMLILRIGNIDLEAPNTPAMNAPNPYQQVPCPPAPFGPNGMIPMHLYALAPMPVGLPAANAPMPPVPNVPVPPMQMTPAATSVVPAAAPATGIKPTSATEKTTPAPAAPASKPVSMLPPAAPVRAVKYEEPVRAATPAQLAGQ